MQTQTLNDIMEFDHVVRIESGNATDRMPDGERIPLYAPECFHNGWGEGKHIEPGTGWTLLEGYTGQYGYRGPVMHASEYIGEGCTLERDILAQDGFYVVIACEVLECDETCEPSGPDCPGGHEPAGWCIAYRETV